MTGASLVDVLAEHAATLERVVVRPAGDAREVVADGRLVAVLGPAEMELRLRPAVAAAALRTPDVGASPRGRGWIRFVPEEIDEFARDRAVAWLDSAVRLVTEGEPGT
jgi:hypothetical protein